ncbi:MAG: hypothetical protein KKF44_05355 [Nanoarchaeota archaeon]|nr:hypothetical protein [Nanoarchaeota archaeon]
MKNKRGVSLTTKSLFAVFVVLFVFFIFFILFKSRIDASKSEEQFSNYDIHMTFFQKFLGNSNCVSVGNSVTSNNYASLHGVLDAKKLMNLSRNNKDMWCMENYDFIFYVDVLDMETRSTWRVGVDPDQTNFLSDSNLVNLVKVKSSQPVVIRYEGGIIHPGTVSLVSYFGTIPKLYGTIKNACISEETTIFQFDTFRKVSYTNSDNGFCVNEDCFTAYFSCKVEDFEIEKGKKLLYIQYMDNHVKVII